MNSSMSINRGDGLGEGGFTLIELLTVTMIIASLTLLAYTGFVVYKDNAYLAKAQMTLHDARTSLEAGIETVGAAGDLDGWSGSNGEDLVAPLVDMFPGLGIPSTVQVHATQTDCGTGQNMYMIFVYACKAEKYTSWIRTCGGFELRNEGDVGGVC
jgi:prepilin-type N-terminal cleavage/methylation domain-containing protein